MPPGNPAAGIRATRLPAAMRAIASPTAPAVRARQSAHQRVEHHRTERIGWVRAAVLGANDGIVATASLLIGVAAAGAPREVAQCLPLAAVTVKTRLRLRRCRASAKR